MKATAPTKALIYCRVSSTKQAVEGHGLDSQEHRCRDYAAARGYEVEAVFPDDVTGGGDFMKRPGMVALISYLDAQRDRKAYVVIFDDLKRFARDTEFHIQLRRAFKLRGASVECLNFRFEDTPEGKFVETIFAAQGELEREQNRRQVIQKMQARASLGYWVFQAPLGYRIEKVAGHGKLLVRDEPLASIVQEALEAYASGRLETQGEIKRFLESQPAWPKGRNGLVPWQRIDQLLTQTLYAGRIDIPRWNIHSVPGRHEALVSLETWQAAQDRRFGTAKAPARKDLREDFPLRGFVSCACCGEALTACWSTGRSRRYAYYLCDTKGCAEHRKSFRKEKIEGEFDTLLTDLVPTTGLFNLAFVMLRDLWNEKLSSGSERLSSLHSELRDIERKIDQLLNRIVDATNDSVVAVYEKRIRDLEMQKAITQEKAASCGTPRVSFGETYRTAFDFLANPWKLWRSERLEDRRAVLRLAFADRLTYARNEGYRTAQISIPFKMIGDFKMQKNGMVEPIGIEPTTS
jgi:DNA invertase Pin-like site-specific DNA recombinase